MIICDRHRFVFVHIPKCAGVSVRSQLRQFEDSDWDFAGNTGNHLGTHPVLGPLDFGHIPLFTLREHFSKEYTKIRNYRSFAIARDPFARFPSSVSQHLKMHKRVPLQDLNTRSIAKEIDQVIRYLSNTPSTMHLLPSEYIHFQRQIDYLYDDGERVIENIYMIDDIASLLNNIGGLSGQELVVPARKQLVQNQTIVYRSGAVRFFVEMSRPLSRLLVSPFLSNPIKKQLQSFIYIPRQRRFRNLFGSSHIKDFVSTFYKDDMALTADLRSASSQPLSSDQ